MLKDYTLRTNTYDYITDFEISRFHKNTKIYISREQNIIFASNKKKIIITHKGLLYCKKTVQ